MQIFVNGQAQELDDTLSVSDLIERLGMARRRIAVEINGEIVPRSSHDEHRLQDGDKIEVVQAIGGG